MKESKLTYQEYKGKVVVKVRGKGTWVEGKTFLDFCERKFKEGKEIYVDLKDCQIIDSTFLGIIASLVLKKRPLYLFHLESPHVLRSIKTLGLSRIFPRVEESAEAKLPQEVKEWEIPLQVVKGKEGKDLINQAHRTLVEAVPENIEKFKDVLELLENE